MKKKKKELVEVKTVKGELLREIIVKIGLEKIDIQKEIVVEALLDNRAINLVISSKFAKK